MSKPVHCKHCDSDKHYSYACYTQRKPITTHKPTLSSQRKTYRKIGLGKQVELWKQTRLAWYSANPATHFSCHYCGKIMASDDMTLDHKIPRSRAPELRHELSNLVPSCWACNGLKGSVAHDDYPHECAALPRP